MFQNEIHRRLRKDAKAIFQAAIKAVDPDRTVFSTLAWDGELLRAGNLSFALRPENRLWVVGGGKAGGAMTAAVEEVLGARIHAGTVVVPPGCYTQTRIVRLRTAGHPFPDAHGLAAAESIKNLLGQTRPGDLVLCLLSGGASSLLPAPVAGITLEDKVSISRELMRAGIDIVRLNTVRKHLSSLKGGGLGRLASPARVLTLILSDVVDDRIDVIASGPTAADPTTYRQAIDIVTSLLPPDKIPAAVLNHFRKGARGERLETVKPGDPLLISISNLVIGNVRTALEAACRKARDLGYRSRIVSPRMTGEACQIGGRYAALVRRLSTTNRPSRQPLCLLVGGETTVTVRGTGRGGRNQELVLGAAIGLGGIEGALVAAMGSDGIDGPTDAAGALADGTTVNRGQTAGLNPADFLQRNDSYSYFKALDDLLITGPTGTNVMDLHLILLS